MISQAQSCPQPAERDSILYLDLDLCDESGRHAVICKYTYLASYISTCGHGQVQYTTDTIPFSTENSIHDASNPSPPTSRTFPPPYSSPTHSPTPLDTPSSSPNGAATSSDTWSCPNFSAVSVPATRSLTRMPHGRGQGGRSRGAQGSGQEGRGQQLGQPQGRGQGGGRGGGRGGGQGSEQPWPWESVKTISCFYRL